MNNLSMIMIEVKSDGYWIGKTAVWDMLFGMLHLVLTTRLSI
jgi:hypothetical protein